MTVLLRSSKDIPEGGDTIRWFALTGTEMQLDPAMKLPRVAARLEEAFLSQRETWWNIGKEMAQSPGAEFAIAPTSATFGSDFGVMLAWHSIIEDLVNEDDDVLAICDDPWLFRHLSMISGVQPGRAPSYILKEIRLAVRGYAARFKVCLRNMVGSIRLKNLRHHHQDGDTVVLVYGHPLSDASGFDAYFGNLMQRLPSLKRLLHTDCPVSLARKLAADSRTTSLHGWGNPLYCLALPWAVWRPNLTIDGGKWSWLLRRAKRIENSGGGLAMNKWQKHCQSRWMNMIRPRRLCWPWENLGWERNLCRQAARRKVYTIGYQHTVIGPHQLNYSLASNFDGLESVPDMIYTDGPAYYRELLDYGMPASRLKNAGALRFTRINRSLFDSDGPIFFPLSGIKAVALRQLRVAQYLARKGHSVVVKDHPMYPLDIEEIPNLRVTGEPLLKHDALSAVVYSSGTSGLEARLAGLPAFRLILEDRIAIDVLPGWVKHLAATESELEELLENLSEPQELEWENVLSPVNWPLWESALGDQNSSRPGH